LSSGRHIRQHCAMVEGRALSSKSFIFGRPVDEGTPEI
jgi:hypothetical protein